MENHLSHSISTQATRILHVESWWQSSARTTQASLPQCLHKLQHWWTGERKGRHSLAWGEGLVSPSRSIILTALMSVGAQAWQDKQRQQGCGATGCHALASQTALLCAHRQMVAHKPSCTASMSKVGQHPLHLGLAGSWEELNCPSLECHLQSRTEMCRQNPFLHTKKLFFRFL